MSKILYLCHFCSTIMYLLLRAIRIALLVLWTRSVEIYGQSYINMIVNVGYYEVQIEQGFYCSVKIKFQEHSRNFPRIICFFQESHFGQNLYMVAFKNKWANPPLGEIQKTIKVWKRGFPLHVSKVSFHWYLYLTCY